MVLLRKTCAKISITVAARKPGLQRGGGSLSGNQVCRCNRSKVAPRALLGRILRTVRLTRQAACPSVPNRQCSWPAPLPVYTRFSDFAIALKHYGRKHQTLQSTRPDSTLKIEIPAKPLGCRMLSQTPTLMLSPSALDPQQRTKAPIVKHILREALFE